MIPAAAITQVQAPRRPVEDLEAEITTLAAHLNAATYRCLALIADFDRLPIRPSDREGFSWVEPFSASIECRLHSMDANALWHLLPNEFARSRSIRSAAEINHWSFPLHLSQPNAITTATRVSAIPGLSPSATATPTACASGSSAGSSAAASSGSVTRAATAAARR